MNCLTQVQASLAQLDVAVTISLAAMQRGDQQPVSVLFIVALEIGFVRECH